MNWEDSSGEYSIWERYHNWSQHMTNHIPIWHFSDLRRCIGLYQGAWVHIQVCTGKSKFHCHALDICTLIHGNCACSMVMFNFHSQEPTQIAKISNVIHPFDLIFESCASLIWITGYCHIISSNSDHKIFPFSNQTTDIYRMVNYVWVFRKFCAIHHIILIWIVLACRGICGFWESCPFVMVWRSLTGGVIYIGVFPLSFAYR